MAINIPLVHISDLTEKKTISDDDYMLTGGSTASKVKWSTIVSLIKTKLGIGNIENNISKIQSDISTLNSDLNGLHFAIVNISGRTDANGQIWVSSPVSKSEISFIDIIGTVRDTGSLPFMIISLKDFDGDNTLVFRCIATNNSTFNYRDMDTKVLIAYKN